MATQTRKPRGGRSRQQKEMIHRSFGDLPLREASADLRVPVTQEDFEGADRKDPEHCVLAQACIREFDSSAVVFLKSVAYLDILGDDGERVVERFMVSPQARAVIEGFDRGESIPADGRWVTLKKPNPSETLDAKYRNRKKSERRRREALRKGSIDLPSFTRTYSKPLDFEVRNGRGRIQMIQAKRRRKTKKAGEKRAV